METYVVEIQLLFFFFLHGNMLWIFIYHFSYFSMETYVVDIHLLFFLFLHGNIFVLC